MPRRRTRNAPIEPIQFWELLNPVMVGQTVTIPLGPGPVPSLVAADDPGVVIINLNGNDLVSPDSTRSPRA